MDLEVKYPGRVATTDEIEFIKELIAGNPCDSRRTLSKKLCEAWNWVQPNGLCEIWFVEDIYFASKKLDILSCLLKDLRLITHLPIARVPRK